MTTPKYFFALRDDLKDNKEFLPTRAEGKASGWDVRAAQEDKKPIIIKPFQYVKIPLGFRAFCPDGWWYELRPRSSSFAKKNLQSLYGVIDECYENELVFACQYIPDLNAYKSYLNPNWILGEANILEIKFGEAIGQIIPIRRQEMEIAEVSNEQYDNACKNRSGQRGTGGFGSSDIK